VGKGFLNKLLGRSREAPPHLREPLAELTRLARDRPSLAGPAAVLSESLLALDSEPVADPPPGLTPEEASARLAGGTALLRGHAATLDEATLDEAALRRRWLAVCEVARKHQDGDAVGALAAALRDGRLNLPETVRDALAGQPEAVYARAEGLGLDAALLASTLRLALFPVLSRWAAELAGLRRGTAWGHGYCPTCGSWPLLAEFRGLEQIRFLRCGLCASEWEFPRLLCPFCGNRDHRRLGYFHAEGEESSRRAATCDDCGGYVKTVATLAALSESALLVADLATLHLDLAAAERGYFVG
jgi:FdhE protein